MSLLSDCFLQTVYWLTVQLKKVHSFASPTKHTTKIFLLAWKQLGSVWLIVFRATWFSFDVKNPVPVYFWNGEFVLRFSKHSQIEIQSMGLSSLTYMAHIHSSSRFILFFTQRLAVVQLKICSLDTQICRFSLFYRYF